MLVKCSLMAAMVALLGCAADDPASCVATLCDPATYGKVCVGNTPQSCRADGKAFVNDACSSQQRCEAGACVARACTTLGRAICATVTEVERCKDDGSALERIACPSATTCQDGACLPTTCRESDADRCTTNGFVACEQAKWVQNNCPVGQVCSVSDNGVARCGATVCAPGSRRCDGAAVKVCDVRGASELSATCASDEVCVAGVCQAEVCGVVAPEVSETTDVSDTTPEPDSRIVFSLNGVANTFDISAVAQFDAGKRTVTVKASKGTKALELQMTNSNQTISGVFSSEIPNPTRAVICYDSGGPDPGFVDVCEGFTHRSTAYEVSITRNDGEGGRFEASFSATLEDVNTDTIALTAGQVNVKYR